MTSANQKRKGAQKSRPPARTLESRENQMISLAVDLAEKQMREGTASSQVITHYLKLGTTREKLEQEKIHADIVLAESKAKSIADSENIAKLYEDAIKAMNSYKGIGDADVPDEG